MRPKTSSISPRPLTPDLDALDGRDDLGFELEDAIGLGDDDAVGPDYDLAVLSFDLETDVDAYVDPPLLDD